MNRWAIGNFVLIALLTGAGHIAAQGTQHLPEPLSPGGAIKDATQAVAATQAAAAARTRTGPIEILSDTHGVEFRPYLQGVIAKVRQNWYRLIPESAEREKDKLAIEFTVLKNGQLSDMKLVVSARDPYLVRAAWGGLTASNPSLHCLQNSRAITSRSFFVSITTLTALILLIP